MGAVGCPSYGFSLGDAFLVVLVLALHVLVVGGLQLWRRDRDRDECSGGEASKVGKEKKRDGSTK